MRRHNLGFLLLSFALCGCAELPTAEAPHPAAMIAVTSRSVRGTVDTNVDEVPAVKITDKNGQPMAGVEVKYETQFRVGSPVLAIAHSDANGIASMGAWKLGIVSGFESVTAIASGLPPVVFTAMAYPDVPVSITATSGNAQKGEPGKELFSPLRARVIDRLGNPVAGVAVGFWVTSGGGSITPSDELTTDADGTAEARWTLGEPGENSAIAVVHGLEPRRYAATAVDLGTDVYELKHIVTPWALDSAVRSKIALLPNGRFVTYIERVWGEGTYSIHGTTLDLSYSDDFLVGMTVLGFSQWASSPSGVERGRLESDAIEIQRCSFDDCSNSVWVYRKLSP
jgi:hypothetical protein